MFSYPFHPAGLYAGGVSVKGNRVTVIGPLTGRAIAVSPLPLGIRPDGLYRQERLFDLFPDARWYIARPWEGEAKLELVRLDRERQVDGVITFQEGRKALDGPYVWTAEVNYSERGPVWKIDAPLPAQGDVFNDIGLRLNISEAIHRFIGGWPAKGQPGENGIFRLHNYFTREDLNNDRPYQITGLSSVEVNNLRQLYGAELDRMSQ